jgi:hypothetical protein
MSALLDSVDHAHYIISVYEADPATKEYSGSVEFKGDKSGKRGIWASHENLAHLRSTLQNFANSNSTLADAKVHSQAIEAEHPKSAQPRVGVCCLPDVATEFLRGRSYHR